MIQKYHYTTCPIQEAVVELKTLGGNWNPLVPGLIFEKVKMEFPETTALSNPLFYSTSAGSSPTKKPSVPEVQFWNKSKNSLLQVGDGIAVANRINYTSWENFRPAIHLIIESYLQLCRPVTVSRFSTRYINRIDFEEDESFNEFLEFGFTLPLSLEPIDGFELTTMSTFMVSNKLDYTAGKSRVTLVSLPISSHRKKSLVVDIDCFVEGSLNIETSRLMSAVDNLHDKVEEIFESFMTDKLRIKLGAIKK